MKNSFIILSLLLFLVSDVANGGETVIHVLQSLLGKKKLATLMKMSPKEIIGQDAPKVKTHLGNEIEGVSIDLGTKEDADANNAIFYSNGKVNMYLNIPYVKPLTKKRRFLLAEEWTNKHEEKSTLDKRNSNKDGLVKFGNACTQQLIVYFTGTEDCLSVNVIAPPKGAKKHPVFVQIHGGALAMGWSKEFDYRGPIKQVVSKGIIFVSFNYRLGALGFLKVFDENDAEYKNKRGGKYRDYRHNIGVEDSIMALKWVKRNIANFGGDPDNIVVGGTSSGSSILELILLTLNQKGKDEKFDLFHRAALFAGTMDLSSQSFFLDQNLSEVCKKRCKNKNPNNHDGMWKCLRRSLRVCKIRYAMPSAGLDDQAHPQVLWALNTPDVVKGRFSDVARGLLNNWTPQKQDMEVFFVESREEWAFYDQFMKPKDLNYDLAYLTKLASIFLKTYESAHGKGWAERNAKKIAEELEKVYTVALYEEKNGVIKEDNLDKKHAHVLANWKELTKAERYTMTMRALTNMLWSIRALEDGKRMSSQGHKVYMMRFSHDKVFPWAKETPFMTGDNPRDIARGIPHGQESRYFMMHYKHFLKQDFQHKEELKVADKMSDFLANFVLNGNPNHGNPAFHVAEKDKPQFFEISSSHKGIDAEKKAAKDFEVHVTPKVEWLNSEVVKFWCKFFKANGMTPFTYEERNGKKVENIPLAMCGDKIQPPEVKEIREEHIQVGPSQQAGADLSSDFRGTEEPESEEEEWLVKKYHNAAERTGEFAMAIGMLQEYYTS